MRGPYHILAKPEQIAEKVIAVGDPARAEHISTILKDAELVNTNRGFPVYTGEFDGEVVTVACHGIGGPSSSIVFEELRMLGAEIIVRLGTAGAILEDMEPGEFLIPDSASCSSTYGALST
ncbi:MAG: 5'-methylthioadenosine phosphorylase, partial [Candidatus Wolframiiraptor sp. EX4484-121]